MFCQQYTFISMFRQSRNDTAGPFVIIFFAPQKNVLGNLEISKTSSNSGRQHNLSMARCWLKVFSKYSPHKAHSSGKPTNHSTAHWAGRDRSWTCWVGRKEREKLVFFLGKELVLELAFTLLCFPSRVQMHKTPSCFALFWQCSLIYVFFRARQIRGQVDDLEAEIVKGELFSYAKYI